ncbi:histidinol dehydrogenase [Allohahella sp. A8]|uniref:histidinol dehydrogenase n=1 Tax=Allohahella sp. A8 TaxID=3141461 RepID=UPI003A80312A
MKMLARSDANFAADLDQLLNVSAADTSAVEHTVADIIADVRLRGDAAVLDYTSRFDRLDFSDAAQLRISAEQLAHHAAQVDPAVREALEAAAARIRAYHERQAAPSWQYSEPDGTVLGQQITPLDSVGIYVPGGKAAYPSSVLMNAIPAKVAGVKRIVMTVPTPDGVINDAVLTAALVAGVDEIFTVGGAQAVAALAYGTATIRPVDKITGPGNIYVATAKKQVFGKVGIDMIAGPSEICVVADAATDPDWLAMDLFSQAEHDEDAQSILISDSQALLDRVTAAIERLLPEMERADIIRKSLDARGGMILCANLDEAIEVVNLIAPEHLELCVDHPERLLGNIRHAGAIFMGRYTPEALGDYCAGPNHVLPTSGTARFSSPLGVYDFQKRSSIINFSAQGAAKQGRVASVLARAEGLTAHARSAEYRVEGYAGESSGQGGNRE